MTTLLILSDVHGHRARLQKILDEETYDRAISLGDLELPPADFPALDVIIHGNAFLDPGQAFQVWEKPPWKLVFTHGHLEHVERSDHGLYQRLTQHHADILFHGHTHVARVQAVTGGWLINPGAISHSRSQSPESYGILKLEDHEATLTVKDVHGTPLSIHSLKKRGSA